MSGCADGVRSRCGRAAQADRKARPEGAAGAYDSAQSTSMVAVASTSVGRAKTPAANRASVPVPPGPALAVSVLREDSRHQHPLAE